MIYEMNTEVRTVNEGLFCFLSFIEHCVSIRSSRLLQCIDLIFSWVWRPVTNLSSFLGD